MLIQTKAIDSPTIDRLTCAWAKLYVPNWQLLPLSEQPALYNSLLETISFSGRAETIAKLNGQLLLMQSQVASIQTSALYAHMENVVNFRELKRLAASSVEVYKTLIKLYEQDALGLAFLVEQMLVEQMLVQQLQPGLHEVNLFVEPSSGDQISAFAKALEPVLLEFQQEHSRSQDWRTLGFLTTQFNFSSQWLMQKLTPCEQLLFQPYLRFIEEQIAHPWQRVCVAAAAHEPDSPILAMIEKLMPQSLEIAEATYQRLIELCPNHHSRRGKLTNPEVVHSCTRDLKMFQSYLWLSVLQGNLVAIEEELLDLCIRVLPSVGCKWELTSIWTQTLADELMQRLDPIQQAIVLPYTTGIHQIFLNAREQFDTPLSRSI